ncbi:MAG: helix-turn-helix transcriptional regulator [Bacteroidetes bacterium]|nr:helix-turn-helix transcriptional regulator [Bacteroidota bacterium]
MKKKTQKRPLTEDEIKALLSSIGQKLQDVRKEKGYKNYETFAFENEIPRTQYGRYERGQDLKVSSLLKVLHALDIPAAEFFSLIGK